MTYYNNCFDHSGSQLIPQTDGEQLDLCSYLHDNSMTVAPPPQPYSQLFQCYMQKSSACNIEKLGTRLV